MSLEVRTIIREIIEARLLQWRNCLEATQVECWSYTLEKIPTTCCIDRMGQDVSLIWSPFGSTEPSAVPRPNVPQLPEKPVALVVTPLIELGNAHVSH